MLGLELPLVDEIDARDRELEPDAVAAARSSLCSRSIAAASFEPEAAAGVAGGTVDALVVATGALGTAAAGVGAGLASPTGPTDGTGANTITSDTSKIAPMRLWMACRGRCRMALPDATSVPHG